MTKCAAICASLLLCACIGRMASSEESPLGGEHGHLINALLLAIERGFRMSRPRLKEPPTSKETATVITTSGEVTGALFDDSTVFYGIPYAEKPFRFMESRLRAAREPIDARKPSKVTCFQSCLIKCLHEEPNQTEDCLVLNVYIPRRLEAKNDDLLPVLFWIHGGGLYAGSGTDSWHDGRWLSRATNTVAVTINYRLGAMGFFTYKGEGLSGNQGIGDQQLAMQWVQLNIDKFGGDKSKVTIFGQNAGGQSVMFHLVSKKSAPFFRRAIMQSNPAIARFRTEEQAQDNTDLILRETKCDSLKCLQGLPAKNIVNLHTKVALNHLKVAPSHVHVIAEACDNVIQPFRPVIGSREFPTQPMTMFRQGKWNTDKDVVVGHTANEVSSIMEIWESELGQDDRAASGALQKALLNLKGLLFKLFIPAQSNHHLSPAQWDLKEAFQKIFTAYIFGCPSRKLARYMQVTSEEHNNIFFYKFKYGPSSELVKALNLPPGSAGKAFHGSELAFLFGNAPDGNTSGNGDYVMRDTLSSFWGNFSYTGMPESELKWPPYNRSSKFSRSWPRVELDVPASSIVDDESDLCDFLNLLGVYSNIDQPSNGAGGFDSKDEL